MRNGRRKSWLRWPESSGWWGIRTKRRSFCIIPFVRGRSRSAPADQVVRQVRGLAERYREVVLSGINLGIWRREPGSRMRLADLIRLLLAETGVERLRLSSVEPMDF